MTISTVMPDAEHALRAIHSLEAEVAELRRELAELRDALAAEVRTNRVVVADGDRHVEIRPGEVAVRHEANGCYALIAAHEDYAMVDVTALDVVPSTVGYDVDRIQHVNLIAWAERDVEPGGPHAEIWTTAGDVPVFSDGRLLLSR